MRDSLYLAWRSISHERLRTVLLVAALAVFGLLPLGVRGLARAAERQLMARALATPLLIAAPGSALDAAVNGLYFERPDLELVSMKEVEWVAATGLALPVPLHARFSARGYTVVGTELDYFALRGLRLASGGGLVLLGDCVLGARVARALGLDVGDTLVTDSQDVFNLAGTYPLKLHVTGVLQPAQTPDDRAVFVDIKTAWVIAGLGHGHQDLLEAGRGLLLKRQGKGLVANARLPQFNEITSANATSFHFHGDPAGYPVTALIAVPTDARAGALLRGRAESGLKDARVLVPRKVLGDLASTIFKVEATLQGAFLLVSAAVGLLLVLVVWLSLRLRRGELFVMRRLGCDRLKMVMVVGSELVLIGFAAGGLALGLSVVLARYADELLRMVVL